MGEISTGKRTGKGGRQEPSDQGDARGQGRTHERTKKGMQDERARWV